MFPTSLLNMVPEPWLWIDVDIWNWGGAVCCLTCLGVIPSLVGPIVVTPTGTSSLSVLRFSIVVFFFCFNPSAFSWKEFKEMSAPFLCSRSCGDLWKMEIQNRYCPSSNQLRLSQFFVPKSLLPHSHLSWSFSSVFIHQHLLESSKRWTHVSFVLAPVSIFERLNFGIVIANNIILLRVLASEKFDVPEECTFIFSGVLDFVWSTTFSSSYFIFRLPSLAAAFAMRWLLEPSAKSSWLSALLCVFSLSSKLSLSGFFEISTSSWCCTWLSRISCRTSLILILLRLFSLTVVSGPWQPNYIVELLPPNSLLRNQASAHIFWSFQYHVQHSHQKLVWQSSWIFFS